MGRSSRVVMFDLGRVLVDWDPRFLYAKLFENSAEMERFLADVCTLDWHAAHDAGAPMAENAAPLIAQHPHFEAEIRAWDARWDEMFAGPIDGAVALLERLDAAGRPLYALSNLPAEKKSHIFETFEFMNRFRDVIVSAEEGVIKPDPRIYAIAARRAGAAPDEVVFIDDAPANVDAARAFGFDAIRYTNPDALEAELDARGLFEPVREEGRP